MYYENMTKKNRFLFGMASIVAGILFIILSILVNRDIFRSIDYDSMVGLQSVFIRSVDIPFSIVTILGSTEVTLTILAIVFLLLAVKNKRLFTGLFLYFLIFIVEIFGKIFINHPMPPKIFLRYVFNIHMPISFFIDTNYSFPSGHMARASFLIVICIILLIFSKIRKNTKLISSFGLLCMLGVVFVSRVYLGEHWLSDVIGGLLVGSGLGLLSFVFW